VFQLTSPKEEEPMAQVYDLNPPAIVRSVEVEDAEDKKARVLYSQWGSLDKKAVATAVELGEILTKKKAELGHGNFLPYLKRMGFSRNKASRAMRASRCTKLQIAEATSVNNLLGINEMSPFDDENDKCNTVTSLPDGARCAPDVTDDNPDVEPDNANGGPKTPGTPKPAPAPQPGTDPKPDPTKPQPAAPKPAGWEYWCSKCQRLNVQVRNCPMCAMIVKPKKPPEPTKPQPNGVSMKYWCENCQLRQEQDYGCVQCAAIAANKRGAKPGPADTTPLTNGHAKNGQAVPSVHEWKLLQGRPATVLSTVVKLLYGEDYNPAKDQRILEFNRLGNLQFAIGTEMFQELEQQRNGVPHD
jgi:hypothetical protein